MFATMAAAAALVAWVRPDPEAAFGMRRGAPDVKSLGVMAFGPQNTLFIGDSEGAQILAVEIEDMRTPAGPIDVAGIDTKIAQALGITTADLLIHDMAVHPVSHSVYLTVTRGRGEGAQPALLRVTGDAARPIEVVSLDNVRHSMAPIPNAPVPNPGARRNPRTFTVTDLAFADDQLWVAGLSNEEFSSAFRRMSWPFAGNVQTTTLEIYHVSHGQNETHAPVMTFMPKRIDGAMHILAAYTCTPLVAFPVDRLKDGEHVFGRTVAELGAGNQPIDMIAFTRDGQDHVLIANSRHPMMRVSTSAIAAAKALTSPTRDEGIGRVALQQTGIRQMADLDAEHIVVLRNGQTGGLDLRSISKSTL
jgi:hypothetical protein